MTAEICVFRETAAICQKLAGVVCVDTAAAHLAGALNVPCEVLLDVNPDWSCMAKLTIEY